MGKAPRKRMKLPRNGVACTVLSRAENSVRRGAMAWATTPGSKYRLWLETRKAPAGDPGQRLADHFRRKMKVSNR
jgi:hypothetical protein